MSTADEREAREAFWKACDPLKDDGVFIGDYIEQLTALLFLKSVKESDRLTDLQSELPRGTRWDDILSNVESLDRTFRIDSNALDYEEGHEYEEVFEYYNDVLVALRNDGDFFSEAYEGVTNKFQSSSNFKRVVYEIEAMPFWEGNTLDPDTLGAAYEELLGRYAKESKSGLGQYFTPRPLIRTMVQAIDPDFGETIHDPASGTCGFITTAFRHVYEETDSFADYSFDEVADFSSGVTGVELVPQTRRLGLMNMILHDIRPTTIKQADSLKPTTYDDEDIDNEFDVIIANPPFGPGYNKNLDSNEQIRFKNPRAIEFLFLQHIMGRLNDEGRAAVIVPEGVLFNDDAEQHRKFLLENYNLHTILVLPQNTFAPYTPVDTNVLFFNRDSGGTENVWYYDLRSTEEPINKANPLTEDHFRRFEEFYHSASREESEWAFQVSIDDVKSENYALNYSSYTDAPPSVPRPPDSVVDDLQRHVDGLQNNVSELVRAISHFQTGDIATPDDWGACELREAVEYKSNLTTPSDTPDKEFTLLDLEDVESHTGRIIGTKQVVGSEIGSSKRQFGPGDILYCKLRPYLNKVVCPDFEGVASSELLVLEPKEGFLKQYIAYFLRSPTVWRQAESLMKGANQPRISKSDLLSFTIPKPPLDEQEHIVNLLDRATGHTEGSETNAVQVRDYTEELRESLIHHAVNGQLLRD
ncbi:N-6 DNA methylase [Salinigranum marinum]|uniref:N-6 DNA methylase n=1 Tax=Salinigranum marinum TaxID=1515595 RepID=UPI002989EAD8|nr:N-6 DNA methylase [Salinigranum marinum]